MTQEEQDRIPGKESTVNDRFNYLVYNVFKTNPPKLAKLIEKDVATIRNITGSPNRDKKDSPYRDSKPSYSIFHKLKNVYPNVSVDWLTTGDGTPLVDDNLKPTDKPKQQKDVDRFVNDNLRTVRNEKRLSQREFAEILGVSETKINGIENGKASATFEIVRRLRKKFGISYEKMIDGFDSTLIKETISGEEADAEKLRSIIADQKKELEKKDDLISTLRKTVEKLID